MVNRWRVLEAAREIRAGAVIAYPTEAVWGLGCDPWNEAAVDRLLAIKNRSVDKGLILVADNIRQFDFLFEDFPQDWIDRMASTWPGPNTWLVPHQDLLPEWVTGEHDTVALRVSDHPLVRDCVLIGRAIDFHLGQPPGPPGRPHADSRRAVLPWPGRSGVGRRPRWAQEPEPDSRSGDGPGGAAVLRPRRGYRGQARLHIDRCPS